MKKIVRIHASSGTTGKPTVVGYTKNDLEMWSDCMARLVMAAGATDEDIVQISFGYGMFTGGLGCTMGWKKIGATVVPNSSGKHGKSADVYARFSKRRPWFLLLPMRCIWRRQRRSWATP